MGENKVGRIFVIWVKRWPAGARALGRQSVRLADCLPDRPRLVGVFADTLRQVRSSDMMPAAGCRGKKPEPRRVGCACARRRSRSRRARTSSYSTTWRSSIDGGDEQIFGVDQQDRSQGKSD